MKLDRTLSVLLAIIIVISFFIFGTLAYFTLSKRSVVRVTRAYIEPTLKIGDFLVLQNDVSASDIVTGYETGDILVYYYPGNQQGEIGVGRALEKHLSGNIWTFKMVARVQLNWQGYYQISHSVNETNIIRRMVDVNSISVYFHILSIPLGIVFAVLVVFWVNLFRQKRIARANDISQKRGLYGKTRVISLEVT